MTGWPPQFDYFFRNLNGCVACKGKPYAWKAKCPAHDDKIQSLSVRVGARGQLYVRCHAGGLCTLPMILRAMRCEMDDLFPDNKRYKQTTEGVKKMARTDTVYPYHDENGKLLFEAVRKEPKSFRQRQPNPTFNRHEPPSAENPEYLYNLEGVRRVLYNLPVLVATLQKTPDKIVLVVEGEKDVETARAAGILATTNPMGAGKWQPEYSQTLRGANVVVIPDNDEPGKAHARAVCESLKGVARTVRYVELPGLGDKEDLTDWWGRLSGTIDQRKGELQKLVKAAPIYGTGEKSAPTVTPAGTAPAEAPKPPEQKALDFTEPDAPRKIDDAEKKALERAAEVKKEGEPTSPTIRAAMGLPNPDPRILPPGDKMAAPVPVPVDPVPAEAPAAPPKQAGPVPADRAARVAGFIADAKKTAAALKVAGATIKTPMEFYAALKLVNAQLDGVYTLADGVPKLDNTAIGTVALLCGAYLFQAAADFGLGCGLIPDEKEAGK